MQEEDIIEHTNAEFHVFTLMGNLLTIMEPRHRPHNIRSITKFHGFTSMVNVLSISVTRDRSYNKASDLLGR